MMKKKFLGLSLLAIAGLWTGCSSDEGVDSSVNGQEISFRVQGGTPTLRTTGTTTSYVNAFVVYGTDNAATSNIFEGVTVARQTDGSFDYNPKKYHTIGAATGYFAAYSPVSTKISNPDATALNANVSFDYEVIAPDATGNTTQEDLLVAGKNVTPTSGTAVALQFEHALSRIFVKAANELNETVIIKGLTLKNVNSKGTITGTAAATWTWAWTSNTPVDYDYILASTGGVAVEAGLTPATLVTSMEQGMMVLPQVTVNTNDDLVFDTGDFALEVTYDVANLTNQKAYILLEDGYEFVMGKQYAVTITFSATTLIEINFTIDVTDFAAIVDATLAP